MILSSNLKIPFVILWASSIGGIIYKTHLENLKKFDLLESQLYKKHNDFQKELTKSNYSYKNDHFDPFRQL
jgi:hypothetical protein